MASSITPCSFPAHAAKASAPTPNATRLARHPKAIDIMADFNISRNDMAMIYLSLDPYYDAFKQPLDLRKFNIATHATAGLSLLESGGHLHLATMSPRTPAAKIKDWRTRVKGAWLIKIGDVNVSTITDAKLAFQALHDSGSTSTILLSQKFGPSSHTMDSQSCCRPLFPRPHMISSTIAGISQMSPTISAHAVLHILLLCWAASTMSSQRL